MKCEFIFRNENNRNLILIFAGWSTDASFYSGIEITGWDVMVCHSYEDLSFDNNSLKRYSTIFLFAWSLGVAVAERCIDPSSVTAAFAINGSPIPVNDRYGIPEDIYNGTAETLSPRNLLKFQKRMAGSIDNFSRFFANNGSLPDDIDIENLKTQLLIIRDACSSYFGKCRLPWKRIYIGLNDRIFLPENLIRVWEELSDAPIIESDDYHLIDLKKIVRSIIPDKKQISLHFSSASGSYDANATAQKIIAERLTTMTLQTDIPDKARILEIGSGTGLFSRTYAPLLKPAKIDYVDIASQFEGGLAPAETFHICDAEEWMEQTEEKWDAILSASTIQWFTDPSRFLKNCAEALDKGGILSFSTFLPGNLFELDSFRPAPLHYRSREEIIGLLTRYFKDIKTNEEEIEISFRSARDLLMHLKNTGVTGIAPTGISPFALRNLTSLTYRPILFTAIRK